MLKRLPILIALAALISTGGCWYGTFMSPRAVGTGKIRIRPVANFPAYVNSYDRDKDNEKRGADELTKGFGPYAAKAYLTYGAGPRFDIGLQANLYSAGIHAKWWAVTRPETRKRGMDFAPILFLDYIFDTQKIAPKLSLVGGLPISRISEFYFGYEGFYGPDATFMDDVYNGRIKFRKVPQEEYQDEAFMGVDFTFRDIGFSAEFGYPIKRNECDRSTTIWFGIGLWYGALVEKML